MTKSELYKILTKDFMDFLYNWCQILYEHSDDIDRKIVERFMNLIDSLEVGAL